MNVGLHLIICISIRTTACFGGVIRDILFDDNLLSLENKLMLQSVFWVELFFYAS